MKPLAFSKTKNRSPSSKPLVVSEAALLSYKTACIFESRPPLLKPLAFVAAFLHVRPGPEKALARRSV
jgi:hypothetical protein